MRWGWFGSGMTNGVVEVMKSSCGSLTEAHWGEGVVGAGVAKANADPSLWFGTARAGLYVEFVVGSGDGGAAALG